MSSYYLFLEKQQVTPITALVQKNSKREEIVSIHNSNELLNEMLHCRKGVLIYDGVESDGFRGILNFMSENADDFQFGLILIGDNVTEEQFFQFENNFHFILHIAQPNIEVELSIVLKTVSKCREIFATQNKVENSHTEQCRKLGFLPKTILGEIPVAISWKDITGKYLGCNQCFAESFGFASPEDIIGKYDSDFRSAKSCKLIKQIEEEVFLSKKKSGQREQSIEKNGRVRWFQTSAMPLLNAKGDVYIILTIHEDITERRKVEVTLKNEQKFLQILMDNIPDSIYFKDKDFRYTKINQAQADDLKLESVEVAKGKHIGEFIDEEEAQYTQKSDEKVILRGESIINKEEEYKEGAGFRYFNTTKVPVRDDNGEIVGLVGVSRDITKDKRLEQEHEMERKLLIAMTENTPDLIYFKDKEGRFLRVNKADANALGVPDPKDVIGKTSYDFHSKDIADQIHESEAQLYQSGQTIENTIERYVDPIGRNHWVNTTKMPIWDSSGKVVGLIGMSRDITHQKQVEEELIREKDLLQTLMNNIPESIYFKNRNLVYTKANLAQAELAGVSHAKVLIGKTDSDLYPPLTAEKIQHEDRTVMETGKPIINQLEQVKDSAKNKKWLSISKVPIRDEKSEEVVGVLGVLRDVTSEEIFKDELRLAKNRAEEANRSKSLFLANMSHEIRTPLNGVIGMSDILKRTELNEEQQELINVIVKSGNNLMTIINDILDFSKIESGKLDLEAQPISVRTIIEDVADVLYFKANDKDLDLITYIDPQIPDYIIGDSVRLRQVLTNLVNNAIKFTPKGDVLISAELDKCDKNEQNILFKVRDTGIGISAENKDKLFRLFSQVDASTTRKYGGTGLGLAISKKLVEMMNGQIGVESEEGKGSTFWFNIKAHLGKERAVGTPFKKIDFSAHKILVLDDSETNRVALTRYFRTWNCKHSFISKEEDLLPTLYHELEQDKGYNVAIINTQNFSDDCLVAAQRIKGISCFKELRIILMTSVSDPLYKEENRSENILGYLNKPIKLIELYNLLFTAVIDSNTVRPKAKSDMTLEKMKVLVVEDNEINRKVAQLTLQNIVTGLDIAEDGKQAVEMWEQGKYDLLLMDIQMPIMNGYEATQAIRRIESERNEEKPVLIVAMSANTMHEDIDYSYRVGMDAYMTKPFKVNDLRNVLHELGEKAMAKNE